MMRIVPGSTWKLNPRYVAAVRDASPSSALPDGVLDVLGIEIDGVPFLRGLGEEALFPLVDALVEVVQKVCRSPSGSGQVSLPEASCELVIGRRGSEATLCLVSLSRPARIRAETTVDLADLALATARCARRLVADVAAVSPSLAAATGFVRLTRGADTLAKAAQVAGGAGASSKGAFSLQPRTSEKPQGPAVSFSLADPEGRIDAYRKGPDLYSLLPSGQVALHDGSGAEVLVLDGSPFLLLTDLSRAAEEITSACEERSSGWSGKLGPSGTPLALDFAAGTLVGDGLVVTCAPLPLARAFLEAALDFAGALAARNAAQAKNPYLSTLADEARTRLLRLKELQTEEIRAEAKAAAMRLEPQIEEAPIGNFGALKRLAFRPLFGPVDGGRRATSLHLSAESIAVVAGARATFIDRAKGEVLGTVKGNAVHLCDDAVLVRRAGSIDRVTLAGEVAWSRVVNDEDALPTRIVGGLRAGPDAAASAVFIREDRRVEALADEDGASLWIHGTASPVDVHASVTGDAVLLASESGFLSRLNAANGRPEFRVRLGCVAERAPASSSRVIAFSGRSREGLKLCAHGATNGEELFTTTLPLRQVTDVQVLGTRVLVAGLDDDNAVLALYGSDGRALWTTTVARGAGALAVLRKPGRLFASTRDGAVACVSLKGKLLWRSGAKCELHRPLLPVLRRDVLFAPGEPVRALDPDTGATLAELHGVAGLSALEVAQNLDLVCADDDGLVRGFRLSTHLSVVR